MNESLRSMRHKFECFGIKDALIISDQCYTFNNLITEIDEWENIIHLSEIPSGNVVSIEGENSVSVISLISHWQPMGI